MSFEFDISQVLQYGFNIFGSLLPVLYLFIGATFAIFVIVKIYQMVKA